MLNMGQNLKYNILLLLSLVFAGCSYHILIKEDGSAHVEINIFMNNNEDIASKDSVADNYTKEDLGDYQLAIEEFYSSDIISNFQYDTTTDDENFERITFDISSIDSLGSYLDPIFETYLKFKLTSDRLIIMGPDGNSNPEDDITGFTNMLEINATIEFEKDIKQIITQNNYVKKIDNNTLEVNTSLGEMYYNGIGNRIEIIFK